MACGMGKPGKPKSEAGKAGQAACSRYRES